MRSKANRAFPSLRVVTDGFYMLKYFNKPFNADCECYTMYKDSKSFNYPNQTRYTSTVEGTISILIGFQILEILK